MAVVTPILSGSIAALLAHQLTTFAAFSPNGVVAILALLEFLTAPGTNDFVTSDWERNHVREFHLYPFAISRIVTVRCRMVSPMSCSDFHATPHQQLRGRHFKTLSPLDPGNQRAFAHWIAN